MLDRGDCAMTEDLAGKADSGEFRNLFLVDLFWHSPDQPPIEIELGDGHKVKATNVSSFKGVRVWEVPAVPGSAGEAVFDQAVAKNSTNRLVIFHDDDKQVWRWQAEASSLAQRGTSTASGHRTSNSPPSSTRSACLAMSSLT
jgi:hypothetical protein